MSEKSLWQVVELKEVISNFIVPMRDKPKKFNGNIPWIRIDDFDGKWITTSKSKRFVDQKTVSEMRLKINPPGTVLCSCSATLGICAITKSQLITNQTFIGLVPSELLDVEFLYYVMSEQASQLQKLSSGTTIAYLPREKFEEFNIKIPTSLKEQQKIAEILTSVDEVIENTQSQIDKLEDLKKATMNELLTKGIDHTEFKETEIGRIPKGWDVVNLEQVTNGRYGIVDGPFGSNLKTEHYKKNGIPVIQSGFVTSFEFKASKYVYVDETKLEEQKRSTVHPNDIVMAKIGANAGTSAIMPIDHAVGILAGNSLKISVDENKCLTEFVHHYLEWSYKAGILQNLLTVTAQPAMSITELRKLLIPMPKIPEQERIVGIIKKVNTTLQHQKFGLKKIDELKKSLMQDLLTGKVRVMVN